MSKLTRKKIYVLEILIPGQNNDATTPALYLPRLAEMQPTYYNALQRCMFGLIVDDYNPSACMVIRLPNGRVRLKCQV